MSQFKSNYHKLWVIHRKLHVNLLNIPETVNKLLEYPQVVQQMIVTHLIFMYSHYSSSSGNLGEADAAKCMYHLRRVVHALAHNDPRPHKHYRVKLNPWQQHYLEHYETLDPFPEHLKSEEEVFAFMWGDDWQKDLELQENATFLNLPRLTTYARQFGFSFDELWFFLRSFQPDRKPLKPMAVNEACKEFTYISDRILSKVGYYGNLERPEAVAFQRSFPSERPGDPFVPAFIRAPPPKLSRLECRKVEAPKKKFEPSGYPASTVDFDEKVRSLKKFDNSTEDPHDPYETKKEPQSERRGLAYMGIHATPSPSPPSGSRAIFTSSTSVGLAPAGPLHAAILQNPAVLESQVVTLLSSQLADLRGRLSGLRSQLETARSSRESEQKSIAELRAELEAERLSREHEQKSSADLRAELQTERSRREIERRQWEAEAAYKEERVSERERTVDFAWKWLNRDRSKDVRVNGGVSNTGLKDCIPPWRMVDEGKKNCTCGESGSGADVVAEKEGEAVVKSETEEDEAVVPEAKVQDASVSLSLTQTENEAPPMFEVVTPALPQNDAEPAPATDLGISKGQTILETVNEGADIANPAVVMDEGTNDDVGGVSPPDQAGLPTGIESADTMDLPVGVDEAQNGDVTRLSHHIINPAVAMDEGKNNHIEGVSPPNQAGLPTVIESADTMDLAFSADEAKNDDIEGVSPPNQASLPTGIEGADTMDLAFGVDEAKNDDMTGLLQPSQIEENSGGASLSSVTDDPNDGAIVAASAEPAPGMDMTDPVVGQKRSAVDAEVDEREVGSEKRTKVDDGSVPVEEVQSTIEIDMSSPRPALAMTQQPVLGASHANATSAELSEQEVASLRALLSQPPFHSVGPIAANGEGNGVEDIAFGRVQVGLENVAEAVRAMERGSEVSVRIGRKTDGRYTCSAPEEKTLPETIRDDKDSSNYDFSDAQESALQNKLAEARKEARTLNSGESLVFISTRKANGRYLFAIVVE